MNKRTIQFCLTLILLSSGLKAQVYQNILRGQILDAESGEPLPHTNVFLANTTLGMTSALDGTFQLNNIPAGTYQLIVNRIGYKLINQEVILTQGSNLTFRFKLVPQPINAGEMQVVASEPKEWKEQLKLFTNWFIGESENARQCTILNPEVLQFQMDRKAHELLASSDSTLRILNKSLGYVLYIVFDKFRWGETGGFYSVFPRFEELTPSGAQEKKQWENRRRETFLGSFQHFITSLALRKAEDEGFMMQIKNMDISDASTGRMVSSDQLVFDLLDSTSEMKKLQFTEHLVVVYRGRQPSSYLKLNQTFVLIDPTGYTYPTLAIMRYGAWAKSRIADTLPLDYVPNIN